MKSNDRGTYLGDIQYDTFRNFLVSTELPQKWAAIAVELGFEPVDYVVYWNEENWNQRMSHDYRLFLILIENGIEFLNDFAKILEDTPEAREFLKGLHSEFLSQGVSFVAIPYDILTLLVLRYLGDSAVMELGIYQWRDDIHEALERNLGTRLTKML